MGLISISKFIILLLLAGGLLAENPCQRLVSIAPSTTEIISKLQLEDNLKAISRYDPITEKLSKLPRIGGYLDLNFEAVIAEKPDLIIGVREQKKDLDYFSKFNIKNFAFNHSEVKGILESIETLAEYCNKKVVAERLLNDINNRINQVKSYKISNKPGVLLLINESLDDSLNDLYLSGTDGYLYDILKMAGGIPAFESKTIALPSLSIESLLAINPDIIIEITSSPNKLSSNENFNRWQEYSALKAVKNKQVFRLNDSYVNVPGPKFIDALEKFHSIILGYSNGN